MKNNPKNKPKGKIEQMRETLALAKSERPVPASAGVPYRLEMHIQRMKKHLLTIDTSCFEIGKELADVQEEKDYPEKSLEQFVKNNFGHTRSWAYQMIDGYKTKAGLPESVLHVIQNQKQALAIAKVPKDKQEEVLKEVSKDGREVTAKRIKETYAIEPEKEKSKTTTADFREVVKDANDAELPEEISKDFIHSQEETKHIRSLLNEVRRWLENEEPFKVEISRTAAIEGVRDVLGMVAVGAGDFICPYCKGKKCKVCHKRGFVSKTFYTQSIPDDKK